MQIFALMLAFATATLPCSSYAAVFHLAFDDLPALIQARNQHVSGARLMLESSQQLTGHLARSYLPTLHATVAGERYRTGSRLTRTEALGSVEARLNVFRGGLDKLEEGARSAQALAAEAAYQQKRLEELTKARQAFWELVFNREQQELLREAIRQNQANLVAANKRIHAGLATATDRLEFEMYHAQLEQDLAQFTLGASNAQRMLNVLLGRQESEPIATTRAIPHQHDDALLQATLDSDTHRDVQAITANEGVARTQKAQAYRWWTPSIDVYTSYSLHSFREREHIPAAERLEPVAGVRMTLNVFDGLQARASGAALGLQAEGLAQQAGQTARELAAQFETARQELRLTHDLIHSAERSVEQGEQYLKRTQSEYARGVKNSPDVFAATQKFVDLKRRYATIRRDYQLAKSGLLAMLGK